MDEHGLRASKVATIDGRIQITPYALKEGTKWFGALRFTLRGHQLGDDVILRERPCNSATQAKAVAAQYVSETLR